MIKNCFRQNSSGLIAAAGNPSAAQYPPDPRAFEFDGYVITTYTNSVDTIAGSGAVGSMPYQVCFCDRIMHGDRAIYRIIYYGELMATSSEFQLASGKMGRTLYMSTCYRAAAGPRSIMLERPLNCPTNINAVLTPVETILADKHFVLRPAFDISLKDRLKTASWQINLSAGEDSASIGCEVSCTPEGNNPITAYATASPKGSVIFDDRGMYGDIRFLDVQLKTGLHTPPITVLAKQMIDFDSPVAVDANNVLYWFGWQLDNSGRSLVPLVVSVDHPLGFDEYANIRLLTLGAVKA